MEPVARPELDPLVAGSDLFEELFQLPDGERYRAALVQAPAWRLQPGESLPDPESRRGAYVLLQGAVEAPETSEGVPRRIFAQWTGLRGRPIEEPLVASPEGAVLLECGPELLRLLLEEVSTRFKVEFYRPLVEGLPPIADATPEVLEKALRAATFTRFEPNAVILRPGVFGDTMFFILAGRAAAELPEGRERVMEPGDFFGEIAVLSYGPRTTTVTARGACLLMEISRDTAFDLRKRSRAFKLLMEQRYRERLMSDQLNRTRLFSGLERADLDAVSAAGTLENYGPYEPVFFQGDPADALYIVLNGTMTIVQETAEGPLPIDWSRAGDVIGEMALVPEVTGRSARGQTVTALQNVDAIRISVDALHANMAERPALRERVEGIARERVARAESEGRRELDEAQTAAAVRSDRAISVGWALETQHIAGNAVLAVDMNDCIRCNNCVTACQNTHADGISRFFWGTMRQDESLLPHVRLSNSCQHCEQPLCMPVCPTNAISRTEANGAVFIDYDKCIRCGKCGDPSQGCAYGSILILPSEEVTREEPRSWWDRLFARKPETPAAGAARTGKNYPVKCDLCHDLPFEACVVNCPTDAVFRIDGNREFAHAMSARDGQAETGNRPPGDRMTLFLRAEWAHPPVAGKPAELRVTVSREAPGVALKCPRPERGVTHFKLNTYLRAPESVRVGGGGALRQVLLPADAPEGEALYPVSSRTPGTAALEICVYQGGLFLTHLPVAAEFAAPPPKAAA